jgi:hypothetical protein
MSVFLEGKSSFWLAGPAQLLGENKHEIAWAERRIKESPALRWVLGKYVEADNANSNKQYWSFDDLQAARPSIVDSPLNLLHAPRAVVGHFVDAEMMFPVTADDGAHPFIEALACFYSFYFPEELNKVAKAHAEGKLAFSMECVSESVTCSGPGGCEQEFAYQGPTHASYCAHLNNYSSIKRLNKPRFLAGALIFPPIQPGWKNAKVKELSELVQQCADEAEAAYDGFSKDFSYLDPKDWEFLMTATLELARRGK